MYGKSDRMPKGIIKHNQKLRSALEKKHLAFVEAGEKIKALRDERSRARAIYRRAKAANKKAKERIEQLTEYKRLYKDLLKEHKKLRREYDRLWRRL